MRINRKKLSIFLPIERENKFYQYLSKFLDIYLKIWGKCACRISLDLKNLNNRGMSLSRCSPPGIYILSTDLTFDLQPYPASVSGTEL